MKEETRAVLKRSVALRRQAGEATASTPFALGHRLGLEGMTREEALAPGSGPGRELTGEAREAFFSGLDAGLAARGATAAPPVANPAPARKGRPPKAGAVKGGVGEAEVDPQELARLYAVAEKEYAILREAGVDLGDLTAQINDAQQLLSQLPGQPYYFSDPALVLEPLSAGQQQDLRSRLQRLSEALRTAAFRGLGHAARQSSELEGLRAELDAAQVERSELEEDLARVEGSYGLLVRQFDEQFDEIALLVSRGDAVYGDLTDQERLDRALEHVRWAQATVAELVKVVEDGGDLRGTV